MQNQIINITQSETYSIYQELAMLGFNVTLNCSFAFNYDQNNKYLSILVKDAESRIVDLYNTTKDMEVVLAKIATENKPCFEIRKHREYADFVKEDTWLDFYKVNN